MHTNTAAWLNRCHRQHDTCSAIRYSPLPWSSSTLKSSASSWFSKFSAWHCSSGRQAEEHNKYLGDDAHIARCCVISLIGARCTPACRCSVHALQIQLTCTAHTCYAIDADRNHGTAMITCVLGMCPCLRSANFSLPQRTHPPDVPLQCLAALPLATVCAARCFGAMLCFS
jgi:hypothetical protein